MRSAIAALLLGTTILAATTHAQENTQQQAQQSSGAADLCREMRAFAEKTAAGPQKGGGQAQAAAPTSAPQPRADSHMSGTQGGGSVSANSSSDTSTQASAPTTTPATTGAAPEAASSPHATDNANDGQGATPPGANVPPEAFKLSGGVTLQQVREVAEKGDHQACRDTTQKMRRAGGGLPADLIALAAYEPNPAKRKQSQ